MLFRKINIFSIWLIILGLFVCTIILIGGYTRISDSGLSITEWLPIKGIFYPLTELAWETEFNKYKKIDEFMLINSSMTLTEFKYIYFWEWFHRVFARFIALIYLIPLIYLIISREIENKYIYNIFFIGLLLAIQAVVGWYMVKSGLTGRVDVSQYRLSLHLAIAFIILGLIFSTLLKFYEHENYLSFNRDLRKRNKLLLTLAVLIFFQIVYGAFVSGTDSGLLYDTWPLYNGRVLPDELIVQNKFLYNFFENKKFIIFFHRTFAFILFVFILYLNFLIFKKFTRYETVLLITFFDIIFLIQIGFGISMTYLNIPWYIALAHQGNSVVIFLLSIYIYFLSKEPS